MNATTEIEATVVHAPGTDMAPYTAQAPEEYRARFVMEPAEAAALDEQLRNCMRAVLKPDVDYGLIPGMGTKPSLFKPGAEKLIQWFGFGFESNEVKTERDDPEYPSGIADKVRRVGVTYRCTVYKELADGRRVTIATCEAYAGYDEDKFYVSLDAARTKAEAKERQWAAKDKRQPNPSKWEYVAEYRAPWNSVIKMCEKRSLVGAAIDATAAAGLFTQDIEDMRADAASQETAGFADAARAAMMALPDEVREGLDRWYHGKRWPDPGQWSAEQWCAALQMAGHLTAGREQPQPPQGSAAAAVPEPPSARESASQQEQPAPAWIDEALANAVGLPTVRACQDLWRVSAAKVQGGLIKKADAQRVQEVLRARMEDLRQEAAALPPEDPWSVKVEALASAEEAADAFGEVLQSFHGGHIDAARRDVLLAAITARFPGATTEPEMAA
jgi:hypothetical protein